MTVPERNMQQLIDFWRDDKPYRDDDYWKGVRACADEASVLLAKLRAEVKEWRKLREACLRMWAEGNPQADALKRCADALEQLIGQEPTNTEKYRKFVEDVHRP